MSPTQPSKGYTLHPPEDYDVKITSTLPYYSFFHQETINLIKSLPSSPKVWMDTGCGTGTLVNKAIKEFPGTKFLLMDPSEGMLDQARKKLSSYPKRNLEFLGSFATQDFTHKLNENPDVITAIQCHHYLNREDRAKATKMCYDLLKDGGIFITFESIRPLTDIGITIGKRYLRDFLLSQGKSEEEVKNLLDRFDTEYFPITVEEHLKLLRETGFKIIELFWYSYMHAGLYCIK